MYPSFAARFMKQQKFTKEDQQVYNNHIIENFIESVKEMNGAVLIPSRLRDLENGTTYMNDDLYEYYNMINTVKKDLFEPHIQEDVNNSVFTPKRKVSRALIQRKEENGLTALRERKISSVANIPVLPVLPDHHNNHTKVAHTNGTNGHVSSNSSSRVSSCSDLGSIGHESDKSSDLKGQNSAQLTDQFIHHLHSMYNILEHFTKAADYITEQYIEQVESS